MHARQTQESRSSNVVDYRVDCCLLLRYWIVFFFWFLVFGEVVLKRRRGGSEDIMTNGKSRLNFLQGLFVEYKIFYT